MTDRAIMRQSDIKRCATVATETGCAIEVLVGDTLIRFLPGEEHPEKFPEADGTKGAGEKPPIVL